jgi:uncharacterized protein (DUF1919 family)
MDFINRDKLYIILFSSTDIISSSIKLFESCFLKRKCIFSHVGILFHSKLLLPEFKFSVCNPDNFIVIESTLSGKLNDDVYDTCGRIKFGVQMRSLTDLIESYSNKEGTKMAIAEIIDKIENLPYKFSEILNKYITKKYERCITNLITIHLPIPSIANKKVFCSELVYRILRDLGVHIQKKNPKKVSPNSLLDYVTIREVVYLIA